MPNDAAPGQPALAIVGVSHAFGARTVLHDVTLTIGQGSFTVLLGLNGAGKTTLFALITRLYHSSAGHIAVLGHDMQRQPRAALARLGVVFQQPTLDLDLTVEQNLFYQASLHGLSHAQASPRVAAELARVGLAERAHDKTRTLSGGQRRRVELARALLHRPRMLLLDEPTVGLDIESRRFLLAHVRHLCETEGLGVLWATHLIDEVEAWASVAILHQGRILASGERDAVTHQSGAPSIGAAFAHFTKTQ